MEKSKGINIVQERDHSLLASFLKTCMKLLRDKKVVEGLQELIYKCTGKNKPLPEWRIVHKMGKGKKIMGHEMRLIVQIREFEMDQVILDLESDANVMPKQT